MSYNIVEHMSPSAFMTSLSNPASFYRTYVLKIYDGLDNMSGLIGKAAHIALEKYYSDGLPQEAAIAAGLEFLTGTRDGAINYGSTGNRETMQKKYNAGIKAYFEEEPRFHKILDIEVGRDKAEIAKNLLTGEPLSLPIKCVIDLVQEDELGQLWLVDHKFVSSYTPDSDEAGPDGLGLVSFKRFIQGEFYRHWAVAKYGREPIGIIYNELKIPKNKDGSPQLKPYIYRFDGENRTTYLSAFYKLYETQIHDLNMPGRHWLPNPNDISDGQFSFEMFVTGIQDVEAPTAVKHKTEDVKFVEKQYIPSKLDQVENRHLSDEERIRVMLQEHAIAVEMRETFNGPSVTKFTFKPQRGIPMKRFATMRDDFAAALKAESVRVETPVPGTDLVGIEVPAAKRRKIDLADKYLKPGTMNIPIGINVYNEAIYKDLAEAPHMLVAGATGAGKSVFINVLIQSLSKQMTPADLKFLMIDPKQVELTFYEDLPHLWGPIVTDVAEARRALNELVEEMEQRYETLKNSGVRKIEDYKGKKSMPRIVAIIDEFADLMMMADNKQASFSASIPGIIEAMDKARQEDRFDGIIYETKRIRSLAQRASKGDASAEQILDKHRAAKKYLTDAILANTMADLPPAQDSIIRIAQKARAVGIHLVLATQRPSAEVVTGLLKANIPTKVCFATTSQVNSRVILDENGAEELTRMGDMLYSDPSFSGLKRLQGLYA